MINSKIQLSTMIFLCFFSAFIYAQDVSKYSKKKITVSMQRYEWYSNGLFLEFYVGDRNRAHQGFSTYFWGEGKRSELDVIRYYVLYDEKFNLKHSGIIHKNYPASYIIYKQHFYQKTTTEPESYLKIHNLIHDMPLGEDMPVLLKEEDLFYNNDFERKVISRDPMTIEFKRDDKINTIKIDDKYKDYKREPLNNPVLTNSYFVRLPTPDDSDDELEDYLIKMHNGTFKEGKFKVKFRDITKKDFTKEFTYPEPDLLVLFDDNLDVFTLTYAGKLYKNSEVIYDFFEDKAIVSLLDKKNLASFYSNAGRSFYKNNIIYIVFSEDNANSVDMPTIYAFDIKTLKGKIIYSYNDDEILKFLFKHYFVILSE